MPSVRALSVLSPSPYIFFSIKESIQSPYISYFNWPFTMSKKKNVSEGAFSQTSDAQAIDPETSNASTASEDSLHASGTETWSECAEGDCLNELKARVAMLEKECEAQKQAAQMAKEQYLRLSAEFDNYRRRTLREKQDLVSSAAASTIKELLPVLDDFDRAIVSAETSDDMQALLEGLRLVQRNIRRFLQSCGVVEIEAMGLPLDTDSHDAITTLAVPEDERKGKIVDVIKKGYSLNGAVLRHAQVIVGE